MASASNFDKGVSKILSGAISLAALAAVLALIPGVTIVGYLTSNMELAILILAVYFGLIYISSASARGFSLPFAIITFAIVAALWRFVPDSISSVLDPEMLLGTQLPEVNALQLFIFAIVFSGIYWAINVRISGSAKKPEKVFDRVVKRFSSVIDIYTTMAGFLVLGAFYILFTVFQNGAQVMGEIGTVLAAQPWIPSNLFAVVSGYLALGGELPIIGQIPILSELSANQFAFITLIVVAIAVMAYSSSSGPTARLLRQFR